MDVLCLSIVVKAKIQEYDLPPIEEEDSIREDEAYQTENIKDFHAGGQENFQVYGHESFLAGEQNKEVEETIKEIPAEKIQFDPLEEAELMIAEHFYHQEGSTEPLEEHSRNQAGGQLESSTTDVPSS